MSFARAENCCKVKQDKTNTGLNRGFVMRQLQALAFCVLGFTTAAPAVAELTGEIIEYGYYQPVSKLKRERNYNTATGYVRTDGKVELVEQTDQIPAVQGRLFGFKFRLRGFPPDAVTADLKLVVQHPQIIRPNGTAISGYELPMTMDVIDGAVVSKAGYKFDKPYEMAEGQWRFEYWYDNRIIVEQTFNVVNPVAESGSPAGEELAAEQGANERTASSGPLQITQQAEQPVVKNPAAAQ
jgi:hypothetical protein